MVIDVGALLSATTGETQESTRLTSNPTASEAWFRQRYEHVISLLHDRGGYQWEAQLTDDLGWSTATTTKTLEELEAAGRVLRYQIGRRTVVCIPDESFSRPEAPQRTVPGP